MGKGKLSGAASLHHGYERATTKEYRVALYPSRVGMISVVTTFFERLER